MTATNERALGSSIHRLLRAAGFNVHNRDGASQAPSAPGEPVPDPGQTWWWSSRFGDCQVDCGHVEPSEHAAMFGALAAAFAEVAASRWRERAQPRVQVPAIAVDNRLCEAMWTADDARAAQKEGWCISETNGSDDGPWQVQKLDDPPSGARVLRTDAEAWHAVIEGGETHHLHACVFIQTHSRSEWRAMAAFTLARHAAKQGA